MTSPDIWFTSDTHFGHETLLKLYPDREWLSKGDIQEFDDRMIERWNSKINRRDTVYHAGDFGGGSTENSIRVIKRLNGKKHLIPGNHDRKLIQNEEFTRHLTALYPYSYKEVNVDGTPVIFCHFPLWEWSRCHRGAWHIHGHLHGKPHGIPGKILDVGVDGHDLSPYALEEVRAHMSRQEIRDHH